MVKNFEITKGETMLKQSSILAAFLVSMGLLTGCGSSSSSTTEEVGYNGIFIDSAVAGISWSCGGVSGVTAADGGFGACPSGSSVSFSVGNIDLGTMEPTADYIFTPQDLVGVPRGETDNADANQIASLLLSLDSDGNPDNGVTITDEVIVELNQEVTAETAISDMTQEEVTTVSENVVEAVVETDPESQMEVVSPEEATSHLDESAAAIEDGLIVPPEQPEPEEPITGSVGGN